MKRGCPNHPKTEMFAALLGIEKPLAVGYLELLFHFAQQYAIRGDIGRWPDQVIAAKCGWKTEPAQFVTALAGAGWTDPHSQHRLLLHDWPEHADNSVHQCLKKRGEVFADGTQPFHRLKRAEAEPDTPVHEPDVNGSQTVGAMPLPLPLPLPEPKPSEWSEWGEKIRKRHPKQAGAKEGAEALIGVVDESVHPATVAADIEAKHAAWCKHWAREQNRYAPKLLKWAEERGYLDWPPGYEQPESQYREWTPPTRP